MDLAWIGLRHRVWDDSHQWSTTAAGLAVITTIQLIAADMVSVDQKAHIARQVIHARKASKVKPKKIRRIERPNRGPDR
jgi:hypothetical protein